MAYGLYTPVHASASTSTQHRHRLPDASGAWRELDQDRRLALIDCVLAAKREEFADGSPLAL
jgi:hypothetical protein